MKKKIGIILMALIVSVSSMPEHINAAGNNSYHNNPWNYEDYNWYDNSYWYDDVDDEDWNNEDDYYDNGWYYDGDGDWYYNGEDYDDWDDDNWYDEDDDYDSWYDDEMTIYDLAVNPSKKKIRAGRSFHIDVIPSADSGWEDISEEEWNEICEENIESIEYHSMKSQIASVNKFTGKVKAKKKGSTVIKTKVNLINDESVIFKTKVTVTR